MRTAFKAIGTVCVLLALVVGCGSSDVPDEQANDLRTSDAPAEPTSTAIPAEPTSTAIPAEPTSTTVPAEPTSTTVPAEPTSTTVPAEPIDELSRKPLPVRAELLPGSYEVTHGDTTVWLDIPDLGEELELFSPQQTEWQVTIVLVSESAGNPEPAFGLAWAEDGATVESVVEEIRATDFGRHSIETSTGVFQGIETTIMTRVSQLPENNNFDNTIITVSTGNESRLQNLYTQDWTIEHHVFERDGRVLIVSYEWSPGRREMVLAEAAPIVESFELRSTT